MARLEQLPGAIAKLLSSAPLPQFASTPFAIGPPLDGRRVAILSTAGLHRRDDPPFSMDPTDMRVIPGDVAAVDLLMSHGSAHFDRSGFQQDWNLVFPIDRLRELAAAGVIGSLADFHYSLVGGVDPAALEGPAALIASRLAADAVDAVLLVPV
ncbi:MAG: selenoprotein B glycine/betaine/sarcosine/D-proline reductase [Deltaproteobacteria bacterium]|nr:selenoprotein B glycine/betaine/sarcosine/D-proline reductase [Deltaproteobacteria bacterium]